MKRAIWLVGASLVLVTAAVRPQVGTASQSGTVRQVLDGQDLFRAYCAACHGADGQGHGPATAALKTAPADLTTIAKRNGDTFPRERLAKYIENGDPQVPAHGSREMPIWGPNFAALTSGAYRPISERIDAVVSYILSIQREK